MGKKSGTFRGVLLVTLLATASAIYYKDIVILINDYINKDSKPGKTAALSNKENKPVAVTLHLKYNSTMEGILLNETEKEYTVDWKGQEYVINKEDVSKIDRNDGSTNWEHRNSLVVKLKKGPILDMAISDIKAGKAALADTLSGGSSSMEISTDDIEYLLFEPVKNDESRKAEETLKKKFSKMQVHTEGNITIITDANLSWVKEYKNTLRTVYTQLYIRFFRLFKGKRPARQNFIVMFDNYIDFVLHAVEDGVPGWAVMGYFNTDDNVMYLYNVLGDNFSKQIYELIIGGNERAIDYAVDSIKGQIGQDRSAEIVIDGQAKDIKDKFWTLYNRVIGEFREMTLSVLRHEFTHGLFSNWGLQNIRVSKSDKKDVLSQKEKEALGSDKKEKKKDWLENLLVMNKEKGAELYDMKASNSWIVEGLATYSETFPIGKQNNLWLFIFQDMIEKSEVYPLEVLTFYKVGSFPGMCMPAMLKAYAQSWAFMSFLMEKYPEQVLEYMDKSSQGGAKTEQEELDLLLKCLNKDSKSINEELIASVQGKYEKLNDPSVETLLFVEELFREFK
jgi:hypothetical protein